MLSSSNMAYILNHLQNHSQRTGNGQVWADKESELIKVPDNSICCNQTIGTKKKVQYVVSPVQLYTRDESAFNENYLNAMTLQRVDRWLDMALIHTERVEAYHRRDREVVHLSGNKVQLH